MRILSINCFQPNSAAAAIEDGKILGAYYESHLSGIKYDPDFPKNAVNALKNVYKDFDKVVFSVPQTYKKSYEAAKAYTNASPTLVDHREALAMSTIMQQRWDTCAVLVVDTFYTTIGYYANKQFYWLKTFDYPNSICLFYSTACRFLGYEPIVEEYKLEQLASTGDPVFYEYITKNLIDISPKDYKIKFNLERGIGFGYANADIASSVQEIFTEVVSNLATHLKTLVDTDNLVFVGKGSKNIQTATAVSGIFPNVAINTASDAGESVLGAAALLSPICWENSYLGTYKTTKAIADDYASDIIKGDIVTFIEGKQAFSLESLGSRAKLAIPYINNMEKLNNPIAIVEKTRFKEFFYSGIPNTTTYCEIRKDLIPGTTHIRCLAVDSSSHPYLNRILKVTSLHGFPVLVYEDIT